MHPACAVGNGVVCDRDAAAAARLAGGLRARCQGYTPTLRAVVQERERMTIRRRQAAGAGARHGTSGKGND
ncbi:hypothetical protein ABW99_20730 [Pandoraea thiooxydans]|uniref:Uncharacterized protein n=1 Tax=Pandoraea thiooxydans TaxID=445709 RepID=A0A0U3V9Z6_9BURK|nr:hypothetical protein ABW99_20730 [Pandoraea thiooxydans]